MMLKQFGDIIVNDNRMPTVVGIPLDAPFVDERGQIQNIWLSGCQSVAVITSKERTIRANHVHTTDWHTSYVVAGIVWYYERLPNGSVAKFEFGPGTSFFTGPGVEHAMAFPVDTVFVTCARNVRDHEHHESDVRRVQLIDESVFDPEIPCDSDFGFDDDPDTTRPVRSMGERLVSTYSAFAFRVGTWLSKVRGD